MSEEHTYVMHSICEKHVNAITTTDSRYEATLSQMKIKNRLTKFPQHGLKFPSISQTNNLRTCTSSEANNENRVAFMYMHFFFK